MPLLDHFHPPLHGPRRWEGFHHAWATVIAQQLNRGLLPVEYYAEPEISLGPNFEVDVATLQLDTPSGASDSSTGIMAWAPPKPELSVRVDFSRLDAIEIRIYQDVGGAELRAAIELISPANKDRTGSRQTFAAKCAGYLKHGISVVIVDVVTARTANLHREIFEMLGVRSRRAAWQSPTDLYAVAYRAVPVLKAPRVETWLEVLTLGETLPVLPLWLSPELCIPLHLEENYTETCRSLRISA
jgi:Protein of unknown function (DUF4058)